MVASSATRTQLSGCTGVTASSATRSGESGIALVSHCVASRSVIGEVPRATRVDSSQLGAELLQPRRVLLRHQLFGGRAQSGRIPVVRLQTRADVREHGRRLDRLIETQQKHQRSIGTVVQALVIDGKQPDDGRCEAEACRERSSCRPLTARALVSTVT